MNSESCYQYRLPPLDLDVEEILGKGSISLSAIAKGLHYEGAVIGGRKMGRPQDSTAMEDRAAATYFLLELYVKHGTGWRVAANEWAKGIGDKIVADTGLACPTVTP